MPENHPPTPGSDLPTYSSDFFRMLDAKALISFAHEPLREYDPIKMLARIAFKNQDPVARPEVYGVIRDIGKQIEPMHESEDFITPPMAFFLRRASGVGVYPYRIASDNAWTITAETISRRQLLLGSDMASMLLYFAGVGKKVVHRSFSLTPEYVTGVTGHILRQVHQKPDNVAALAERLQTELRPLRLWPLPLDKIGFDSLRRVMGGIFENTTIGPPSSVSISKTSLEKQVAILDALSIRYLERPSGTTTATLHDPHKGIDLLRQRCMEQDSQALADAYGVERRSIDKVLKRVRDSLRSCLASQDIALIAHFLEDDETTLSLPRLPLYPYRCLPSQRPGRRSKLITSDPAPPN